MTLKNSAIAGVILIIWALVTLLSWLLARAWIQTNALGIALFVTKAELGLHAKNIQVLQNNPDTQLATTILTSQNSTLRGAHDLSQVVYENLQSIIPMLSVAVAALVLLTAFVIYKLLAHKK